MASPSKLNPAKGWFVTPTRAGDRTLNQQMLGLEKLVHEVTGKSVLDIGCAEGLISMALVRAGATKTTGLEIVAGHVEVAKQLSAGMPCTWLTANLNDFDCASLPTADVVLMLAVLHKVRDPSLVCAALAARANDLCVVRLPPNGPVIVDARSNNVPHNIVQVMDKAGFKLESEERVMQDSATGAEWLGYFRRRKSVKVEPIVETLPVAAEAQPQKLETEVAESGTSSADPGSPTTETASLPTGADHEVVDAGTPAAVVVDDVQSAPSEQDEAPKVTSTRRRRGLGKIFGD